MHCVLLHMMFPGMVVYDMKMMDHVVAGMICIVAPILAFTANKISTEDMHFEPEDKVRLYHSNALLLVVFALLVTTMWRLPGRTMAALGFVRPQWNYWIFFLLVAVFLFYILDIFFQYGLRRWREKAFQQRNAALNFVPADRTELFHFLFLALAAGIGEEIIFRGYLIHYFVYWTGNSNQGVLTACVCSAALFAFLHGYQGVKSMIKIFFLALLFSAIYVLSQSLLIVIIIHTIIDILSGWLGIFILRNMRQEESAE